MRGGFGRWRRRSGSRAACDAFNAVLDQLHAACPTREADESEFLEWVCEEVSRLLDVDRVGVWRLSDDERRMTCGPLFDRRRGVVETGKVLDLREAPNFVTSLRTQRSFTVEDVERDPRTADMAAAHFTPVGIRAIMHAQIHSAAGAAGFLTAAVVGGRRKWRPDETAFAASAAAIIGMHWDRSERARVFAELERRNEELARVEGLLTSIVDHAPGVFLNYLVDADGAPRVTYVSRQSREIWEHEPEAIVGDVALVWDCVHPEDAPILAARIDEAARNLTQFEARWRVMTPSGEEKWLLGRATPQPADADGAVVFTGFVIDVTAQVRAELEGVRARREAELASERFVTAIEALPAGFVMYDSDDKLLICNEEYRRLYAHIADVILPGRSFESIIRTGVERGFPPVAVGREDEWVAERMAEHLNPRGAIEQELPDDRHLKIHESRTETGDIVGFRVEITELKRQQRRLEELAAELAASKARAEREALHDGLTGLPNRRHIDRKIAELAELGRPEDVVFALHIDLDRFKHINDTLGHAAGDHVLKTVGATLRAATRAEDFVARIGGDEFFILCGLGATAETAEAIAERIVADLGRPIDYEGQPCRFGASVGVASAPARCACNLLVNADLALYEAKGLGRNRVEIFTSDLQERLNAKKRTADEILRGLEHGEFEPHFQPQFTARDRVFAGVEALARWRHPERGVLAPAAFLGVAAELNVVDQLDRTIFRQALDVCARLKARGAPIPKLSVNVSVERLKDAGLAADVERFDGQAGGLAFELLETINFDEDYAEADWALDRLRDLGVELEIDDFGSGRASIMSLLKIFPKRIKIDRQLVAPIVESRVHLDLVRAIVDIGVSQKISVIAEGVETAEHARILRDVGCEALQGYYFAAPMAEPSLGAFLRARAWPGAPTAA